MANMTTILNMTLTNLNVLEASNEENGSTNGTLKFRPGLKTYMIIGLALMWIWAVLIISLNVIVIVIICGYKKRTRLYFFLLNLAIADLAVGILDAFPHAIERSLGVKNIAVFWVAGEVTCKIQRTISNTCFMSSNYILAVMSIDRTYAICRPMQSIKTGSTLQKLIVLLCWLFCFACSSPYLKYYGLVEYPYLPGKYECFLALYKHFEDARKAHAWNIYIQFVLMFLVPLFVITASYILLIVVVFRRAQKQGPCDRITGKVSRRQSMFQVFNKGMSKSRIKSIKLTIGIVLSFVICWMSYFVGYLVVVHAKEPSPALLFLTTFSYCNSIANPILFFIYHKKEVQATSSKEPVGQNKNDHQLKKRIADPCT